jgi:hypothetical protein
MTITFVSAFLDLSEDRKELRSPEVHLNHFLKIAKTGINIHLFINESCKMIYTACASYPNIHIDFLNLEDLRSFQAAQNARLPDRRNPVKDTKNFILFMNAKPDFVYRAIQRAIFPSSHYCWLDFGLFHVIKDTAGAQTYLQQLSTKQLRPGLFIPGCVGIAPHHYFDNICWRFCGGVFVGDKQSLIHFYETVFHDYDTLVQKQSLTWEVNIWAYLESIGKIHPIWFPADHNDSILRIPAEYYKDTIFPNVSAQPIYLPQKQFVDAYGNPNAYIPMNPSLYIKDGQATVLVRCINYRKYKDKQFIIYEKPYSISKYYCLRGAVRKHIEFATVEECKINTTLQSYSTYWKGLEDIRFITEDTMLAAIPEYTPSGNPTIFRASLTGATFHSFEQCEPNEVEKNWMPYFYEGEAYVVYSVNPFCIKDVKGDTRRVISEDPVLQGWHGSTNGIPFQGKVLFLIHANRDVSYHRWLLFNQGAGTIQYSEEFTFFKDTYIEFPCSLCIWEDRVFVSMGVNDDSAFLVEVAVADIQKWV